MTPFETVFARLEEAGAKPCPARRGFMAICPAHADKNASLNIDQGDGGRVILRCYAGCETKNVLESLGLTWGHLFPDGAPYRTSGGPKLEPLPPRPKIVEPVPPVPDADLLQRIIGHALDGVQTDAAWPWLKKRGVSVETCLKWCVGYMPWIRFKGWRGAMPRCWVIPVSDSAGNVVALKLHREQPPEGFQKGSWAPIGTQPADKPRHGFATFWPAPESFPASEKLYLLPGELKALAVLGAGRSAISITAGEGMRWTPGLMRRIEGRRVVIVYDDDEAGRRFLIQTTSALRGWVASLSRLTFGSTQGDKASEPRAAQV
jgi:hypothetical protein